MSSPETFILNDEFICINDGIFVFIYFEKCLQEVDVNYSILT
jgi:hypothetical protein